MSGQKRNRTKKQQLLFLLTEFSCEASIEKPWEREVIWLQITRMTTAGHNFVLRTLICSHFGTTTHPALNMPRSHSPPHPCLSFSADVTKARFQTGGNWSQRFFLSCLFFLETAQQFDQFDRQLYVLSRPHAHD